MCVDVISNICILFYFSYYVNKVVLCNNISLYFLYRLVQKHSEKQMLQQPLESQLIFRQTWQMTTLFLSHFPLVDFTAPFVQRDVPVFLSWREHLWCCHLSRVEDFDWDGFIQLSITVWTGLYIISSNSDFKHYNNPEFVVCHSNECELCIHFKLRDTFLRYKNMLRHHRITWTSYKNFTCCIGN